MVIEFSIIFKLVQGFGVIYLDIKYGFFKDNQDKKYLLIFSWNYFVEMLMQRVIVQEQGIYIIVCVIVELSFY